MQWILHQTIAWPKAKGVIRLQKHFRHHLSCNSILRILFSVFTDPCPASEHWVSHSTGNYQQRKHISITWLPPTCPPQVQTKTERFIKPYPQNYSIILNLNPCQVIKASSIDMSSNPHSILCLLAIFVLLFACGKSQAQEFLILIWPKPALIGF